MTVSAVIFDWGGTLTPWHTVDHDALWREVCAPHFPGRADEVAAGIVAAEHAYWELADTSHSSATLDDIFARAGVAPTEAMLAAYYEAWDPHTITDPEAIPLLRELRGTRDQGRRAVQHHVPREAHERVFRRDEVLDLIDAAVYSSEIPWAKPHPEAFLAVMRALDVEDPAACVFVGDRPFSDVHGAKRAGMRAVLIPHSEVPPFDEVTPDAVITRLADLPAHLDAWSAPGD